jgi:hypothetical protein
MIPIEYDCGDNLTAIRLCPKHEAVGMATAPAYWYLMRPMATVNEVWRELGYEFAYWTGAEWSFLSPKQFPTPEEAFAEYQILKRPPA